MLEDILLQVNKPARYIGNEWNVSRKDFAQANIRFGLCFPDLYEVGMSNLGLRIIYGILNNIEDVVCERFFSLDSDMENILRNNHLEIFSLESKKGLKEFDIIGFSLSYELDYTNVLNILDLGRVPLRASLRSSVYPLIIGGGPCVLNPEPLHEFFDLFVLGEAEEVILEIIDIYRKLKGEFKQNKITKQDLLFALSGIEGVYVPAFYEVRYTPEGKIKEFKPKIDGIPLKIKKRFIKNLDSVFFPLEWLLPYIQIVHDRLSLEIMRGCPNRCRFCQGKPQYFPFRQRSLKNILNLSSHIYKCTGYEELSLSGLSVSDYSDVEELLGSLINLFKEKAVSVSLPSIKPKTYIGNLLSQIASIKKTGLTFAPEAGTNRMRNLLAKDFDTGDFFKTLKQAYLCGYQRIKLYFMIGLPYEETGDLDGIVEFALKVSELKREINSAPAGRGGVNKIPAYVNISVNTLIPKPHTAFQWLEMTSLDNIKYKQDYLKNKIRKFRRLKLSFHNPGMSLLECILSRGDRRLSEVIFYAFEKGARFDAWGDYFLFDTWLEAFNRSNLDYNFYLQAKSKHEILPWDFLDVGMSKETLLSEFNKVIALK